MLSPQDIFIVAAHEYKEGIEQCRESAKEHGLSPERLSHAIMIQEYSDPRLIRIRAGNTLFTIAAFPEEIGFVRGYNADTASNYIENIIELTKAARKMGFVALVAHVTTDAARAIELAAKKEKNDDLVVEFDKQSQMIAIALKRGK